MRLKINEVERIKKICKVCNEFADDVYAISGNYRVNAKSLLGLLSLDLSQEIELIIDTYKDNTITNFITKVKAIN